MARIAFAILVLLAPAAPASPQSLSDPSTRKLLDDWVIAVRTHVPGVLDGPVATIAAWDRDALRRAQPLVRAWVNFLGAAWRTQPLKSGPLSEADAMTIKLMAAEPINFAPTTSSSAPRSCIPMSWCWRSCRQERCRRPSPVPGSRCSKVRRRCPS